MYRDAPCTEVVGTIDGTVSLDGLPLQGMLWGFLLGFDQANGGLQGGNETTLSRLRKACSETPRAPAIDLLRSFVPAQ